MRTKWRGFKNPRILQTYLTEAPSLFSCVELHCKCNESIEFEWPVPSSPGPLGHIEPASATVDDPEMQLSMCTYTLSSTFAILHVDVSFLIGLRDSGLPRPVTSRLHKL